MTRTSVQAIPRRVHLVGVGGIHMSGIAQLLRARGISVTGSDLRPSSLTERLQSLGVKVYEGHDASYLGDAELVVYTSAAPDDNPELAEARRRRIPSLKRAEMVARLMEGKQVIAVAGSHGKTTTTSLIAYMLWRAGLSPTFMLGGEMIDLDTNVMPGEGPHFVVEADEFDAAFLNYRPDVALVTNVDADHLDFYGSFERLAATFRQFLSQVTPTGHIVACGDDPALQAILNEAVGDGTLLPVRVVSYGLDEKFQWHGEKIRRKGVDGCTFMLKCGQENRGRFQTRLPGVHNVRNSVGALAVGSILGLPVEAMRQSLAEFRGVRRRFELVGEATAVTVMDDYAHHPTEIRATLAAARERFSGRRLVCLFQPHTYSRTQYLLDEFRTCFTGIDVLLIADTYAAREPPSAGMDARQLAEAIQQPPARYVGGLEEAAEAVLGVLRAGDVFFTIGAGDVDSAGPLVLAALRWR
ncbi:MAG: UDP-N-acetylmuramate--L-alanine ligase [Chloroflexi bacterium]|nr:UDP-N-acetylmuramate--L-alanine ligase [Chloroflexota bacterium]